MAVILFVSLSVTFTYSRLNKNGTVAVITHDGVTIKQIDLKKEEAPREWIIDLPDGACNTVRVEPGRIRFVRSNCPKQICVATGWLNRAGEIAVCLPHRLMISVEGKDTGDDIDALSR